MHLKNFSLIAKDSKHYALPPAYDMVAVKLLIPEDQEELALNLNGKSEKLNAKILTKPWLKHKYLQKLLKTFGIV